MGSNLTANIITLIYVLISLWNTSLVSARANFVRVERKFGERVISAQFGDISAVEVTASDGPEIDIVVRQITDGHRLIQGIYDNQMILKECKVDTDTTTINNFISKLQTHTATTSISINDHDLDLSYVYNSTQTVETRTLLAQRKIHLPRQLQSILDIKTAKVLCRSLGRTLKEHLKRRRGHEEQRAGEEGLRRNKRDLLIFPGTLWCGVGDVADGDYENLGEEMTVDRCCRKHDHCPNYIESFESGFDLFNFRLYTISDCQCDNEFLECLKNTTNTLGLAVARAYFNLFGISCFTLATEDRCVEYGWWGRCLRTDQVEIANIDQIGPYEEVEISH